MLFINSLTPEHINQLCKESHKVKVEITATVNDGEIVHRLPNGESVTETYEQITFQMGTEIKSWADLFQINPEKAHYLHPHERKSLV